MNECGLRFSPKVIYIVAFSRGGVLAHILVLARIIPVPGRGDGGGTYCASGRSGSKRRGSVLDR